MKELTLLIRIGNEVFLRQVEEVLKSLLGELEVEAKMLEPAVGRWVRIALSGEDEKIAANYIAEEIGVCPSSLYGLKRFEDLKGYILPAKQRKEELLVDFGIFQPEIVHAAISLNDLQAQLTGGMDIPLEEIARLFALTEGVPVGVKIEGLIEKEQKIEAKIADSQVAKFVTWRESLLDRLLIVGTTLPVMKLILKKTYLERDVINIESLGIFEQVLTCKLGTKAEGVIPIIGRKLRKSKFIVFSPERINSSLQKEARKS